MANQKVEELTAKILEKITGEEAVHVNVMMVCEEYFQFWTEEMFPPLRSAGKNPYRVVSGILVGAGYQNANEKMVRTYFERIRKKRGLKQEIQRVVQAEVAQSVPPPSHPQQKVVVPVTVPQPRAVVSMPVVSEPVAPVEPQELDVDYLKAQLARLKEGKNSLTVEWTQDDEKLWSLFVSIVKAAYSDLKSTSECKAALGKVVSIYPDMLELLKVKRIRLSLPIE
ncbi:hypothetical protein AWB71_05999 [Caballeronia peredens]|nr:hypothetical protein AWB71_05999 [Caballeronia peredens]